MVTMNVKFVYVSIDKIKFQLPKYVLDWTT